MEKAMMGGGIASVQFYQQSQQLAGQTVQLNLQKLSQTSESLINRASANTVHNQQTHITNLQNSLQRGQAMDMYV